MSNTLALVTAIMTFLLTTAAFAALIARVLSKVRDALRGEVEEILRELRVDSGTSMRDAIDLNNRRTQNLTLFVVDQFKGLWESVGVEEIPPTSQITRLSDFDKDPSELWPDLLQSHRRIEPK